MHTKTTLMGLGLLAAFAISATVLGAPGDAEAKPGKAKHEKAHKEKKDKAPKSARDRAERGKPNKAHRGRPDRTHKDKPAKTHRDKPHGEKPDKAERGPRKDHKAAICHVPAGNPDKARIIHIGASAVEAHLRHGDCLAGTEGCACESRPPRGDGDDEVEEEVDNGPSKEFFSTSDTERRKHLQRMARLKRLETVAVDTRDKTLKAQVLELRGLELKRHDKRLRAQTAAQNQSR